MGVVVTLPNSDVVVVDPGLLEERVQTGSLTLTINAQRELCAISKAGGLPITTDQLLKCATIAGARGAELQAEINRAVQQAVARKERGTRSVKDGLIK